MNWNRYQGLEAYFLYQELIVVVSEFHNTGKSLWIFISNSILSEFQ